MTQTTSYAITDHHRHYIQSQVASGRYKSASDVITEALRQHEVRSAAQAKLFEMLDEGKAAPSAPFDPEEFKQRMRLRHGYEG